ncbi:DUF6705 family protein [Pontimicrobium sp. MEBiC01747]
MKTYIYLLITVLGINAVLAQETIVPINILGQHIDREEDVTYYYKDVNGDLDKFLGTWVYNDATISFTINFSLLTHYQRGGYYFDLIYAKIKFINNGNVIYNTLNELSYNTSDISGSDIHSVDSNKIDLNYRESNPNAYRIVADLDLEYVPCLSNTSCEQLVWHNRYLKDTPDEPWPFFIPTDMVLTRQ